MRTQDLTREMGPDGSLYLTDGQGVFHGEWVKKGNPRNKKTFAGPWVNVFQERLAAIAADRDLRGVDFRVLLVLLSRASLGDSVFDSNPTGIATDLGVDVSHVTRSLRTLAEKGLIERPARGKVALHHSFAFRGSAKEHAEIARGASA